MKYIDADKLRAEIEKRMHICDGVFERDSDTYYQGKAVAYQETLSFIDSLQQEQPEEPVSEDLEDEMEKFGERWPYPASFDGYDKDWVDELTEECAKHFYELGKKDMKAKMMEGAVDYKIVNNLAAYPVIYYEVNHLGLKYGDKVRIIIVKEDGE